MSKNINALLYGDYEEKDRIVEPWLLAGTLTTIFAGTGIGKTFFSLYLSLCVASGRSFLHWRTQPRRVLYVDGEMGYQNIAERVRAMKFEEAMSMNPDAIEFLSFEDEEFSGVLPNLVDPNNFSFYEKRFADFDVIIIDNIDTCSSPLTPQDSDLAQWIRLRPWLIKLRSEGKAVVLVDHANKGGGQYGTSKKANSMDVVLSLSRPEWTPKTAAENCFKVQFEKGRHLKDRESEPIWIEMFDNFGETTFKSTPYHTYLKEQVMTLEERGMSDKDIIDTLSISKQALLYVRQYVTVTSHEYDYDLPASKEDDDEVVLPF